MALNNPYAQYKQNSVTTASPQELNIMLYTGALKFIKQSIINIENKNIQGAHNSNIRAQDIFIHFMSIVDRNNDIGKELFRLYDYIHYRLKIANAEKNIEILEEVYEMTKELKETWEEAIKIAKSKGK